MDDAPAPETTHEAPADARPERRTEDRSAAWPSPPPQTVEHAVALLASTWTRGTGAA